MKIINCDQGSEDWFKVKHGIPSASSFDKIVTTKGDRSKQREKYLYQLAGERVIGKTEETYQNDNMLRGIELEDEARKLYELISDKEATRTGFFLADGYGCSPDGIVEPMGLLEIKCPILATHVGYLVDYKLPMEYFQQVQGQLLVTGRQWCDFMSYYPELRPLIIHVNRNEEFIEKLKAELELFCIELNQVVDKIKEK
jgi:hypothetical protein